MKLKVFNQAGKEMETIEAPKALFEAPMNRDLLHQVVISELANARVARADAKDRAEVRGGGKKPWRQKGTGRARHGSSRSPIWRGGGITHGPLKEKNFAQKINKKVAASALAVALSAKAREEEAVILDKLSLPSGKTKEALGVIRNLAGANKSLKELERKSKLLVLPESSFTETRAFRNLERLTVRPASGVTASEVLAHGFLVLPRAAIDVLEKRLKFIPLPREPRPLGHGGGGASSVKHLRGRSGLKPVVTGFIS